MKSLLLRGGKIYGGTGWNPPRWADSLLVANGVIRAVGTEALQEPAAQVATTLDLGGALVLPGLGDAHLHLAQGGRTLQMTNLRGLDLSGILQSLRDAAATPSDGNDTWIRAVNWESWRASLDAEALDRAVLERPTVVFSRDLHSCCVNTLGLKAAGITSTVPTPAGGEIVRDPAGNPRGILRDTAVRLVLDALPIPDPKSWQQAVKKAQAYLLSLGVTAVSEVLEPDTEGVYFNLDWQGELVLDVDGWRRWNGSAVTEPPPPPGRRFRVGTLKVFLDGSFGSRTAALNQPYLDEPDNRGILMFEDRELVECLMPAVRLGWRIAFHAIGDRAVEQACRVLSHLPKAPGGPHRIEHVQHCSPEAVRMLPGTGAAASVQPVHLLDDSPWLGKRIGRERCRWTFIWRTLYRSGVPLALGSDWPVASPDPLLALHAAVNRAGFDDAAHPDFDRTEALPPTAAIRAATFGWAYAAGLSERRGGIAPGMAGDLTVIRNPDRELKDWSQAKVLYTICNGEIVT